jgi:hypothetical protein
VAETAEEKRLRVAKQYLSRVKAQAADLDSDDGSDGEADADGEVHRESSPAGGVESLQDRISARLQKDFMEGAGHLTRRIAHRVCLPERVASEGVYGASNDSTVLILMLHCPEHCVSCCAVSAPALTLIAMTVLQEVARHFVGTA